MMITNGSGGSGSMQISSPPSKKESLTDLHDGLTSKEDKSQQMSEILDELDWCLAQLENMQSHKSISDIASIKV